MSVQADKMNAPDLPNPPYVVDEKLTSSVNKFLATIFNLFSEDEKTLDKGGVLSVLVCGYPDKEIPRLIKSVGKMFQMSDVPEDGKLTYEDLFDINVKGAKNEEAFLKMLTNLQKSYIQHQRCHKFLLKAQALRLPQMEPLQMMLIMKECKTNDKETEKNKTEGPVFDLTFDGVVELLKNAKKITVMAGAGISTSCGIPDFRTPGTGLYDNLQKYDLPEPTAVFQLSYFKDHPEPFFLLSKELYPENFNPSPTHYFISLLAKKGLLTRHYTQNIDGLERLAGVPDELLVEAHGSYASSTCLDCGKKYTLEETKEFVFGGSIPRCQHIDEQDSGVCNGLVKPDIVFFGEGLPPRFTKTISEDFRFADALLVCGTSLTVAPFNSLVSRVNQDTPRVLLNMEKVGEASSNPEAAAFLDTVGNAFGGMEKEWTAFRGYLEKIMFESEDGFIFPPDKKAARDVFLQGSCDDTVLRICKELGWLDELNNLMETTNAKLNDIREEQKNAKI